MSQLRRRAVALGLAVLLGACVRTETLETYQGPSGSQMALKVAVLQAVGGRVSFCDPDRYPVAWDGSAYEHASVRVEQLKGQPDAYADLMDALGFHPEDPLTREQTIQVSDVAKRIDAIQLHPADDGTFDFTVFVPTTADDAGPNRAVVGAVTNDGSVMTRDSDVTPEPPSSAQDLSCPICLARGQVLDTPAGPVAVQDLSVGDPVWTADASGQRMPATVIATGQMEVPEWHEVMTVELEDGRSFAASPGHPTSDGRLVGQLRPGDPLDGSVVAESAPIHYPGTTFDVLPSGPTGTYFVNGVLLSSTLQPR